MPPRRAWGAGTVRERRPGYWEVRVDLGADPRTGRRRRISRSMRAGTRPGEGQKAARGLLAELIDGARKERLAVTEGTVAHQLTRWLEAVEGDLAATTLKGYRGVVDRYVVPELGEVALRKLKPSDLNALYQRLRRQGLSPTTVRGVHAVLRRALGEAVRDGTLPTNPAVNARPPKARKPELRTPSPADVDRLVAEAERRDMPELATFIALAVATGLRRGEMCALRWKDVDLERAELRVGYSIVGVGRGGTALKDTKTHQVRRVALDPGVVDVLRAHRQAMEERAEQALVAYPDDAALFSPLPDGSAHWHPDVASHRFREVADAVGLDEVRLHDLRHAHATYLLDAGVPVKTVSARLGHAQASTTLNIYAHALEAADREAATAWGRITAREEAPPHSAEGRLAE